MNRQATAENQERGPSEETLREYGACIEESIFSSQEVTKGEPLKGVYVQIWQQEQLRTSLIGTFLISKYFFLFKNLLQKCVSYALNYSII